MEICDERDNDCDGQIDEGGGCEGASCIGCADAQRDALESLERWPIVAACEGRFLVMSLRAPRRGRACGDDLVEECAVPEDLCAQGWRICMHDGYALDLRFRLQALECNSLSKPFVAASNHCSNKPDDSPRSNGCDQAEPYGCGATGWHTAPIVCGPHESSHCAHGVWPRETHIFGPYTSCTENTGCGRIGSETEFGGQGQLAGVLCCRD